MGRRGGEGQAPRPIPLQEADLLLFPQLLPTAEAQTYLQQLTEEVPWRQETITLFGKTHLQPRLIAWYGDPEAVYRYSGTTFEPLSWTPLLHLLRRQVEQLSAATFNSVLLNYYRDGGDAMGLHADDEPELGPEPVIASLSLGATRKLYFKHRRNKLPVHNLLLPSGSLLLMRGPTQQSWKHGIRKTARDCGPRINLTFRRIYPS